jgi:hypothetical protein
MKSNTPLNILLQSITRALGEGHPQAMPLRETNILSNFTPKNMVKPFKDLPNVSNLWVRPNVLDPLLSNNGLASKLSPEMSYEAYSWRTKAANRYLRIMYYKMERLLSSGSHGKYWVYALNLMLKSKVIRACALRKLDRNWHRNFKFGTVKALLARLDTLLLNVEERISIKRTYAVKSIDNEGNVTKWRPIGNPDYPDRMYLYIWQSFFVIYVNSFISPSQHAYRPGKGVATALKELKTIIENKDFQNIYEFDLKGAFPSVSIKATTEALTSSGFPTQLGEFLLNMSSKTIEMVDRKQQKMPEDKFDRQEKLHRGMIGGFDSLNPQIEAAKKASLIGTYWTAEEPWAKAPSKGLTYEQACAEDPDMDEELFALLPQNNRWGFESSVRKVMDTVGNAPVSIIVPIKEEIPMHLRGFPQGSAWSPVLFNFAFEYAALRRHFKDLDPSIKLLSYADDFIAATRRQVLGLMEESATMKHFGLVFNTEKSRPLKLNGRWQVSSFKFLGVTFHVSNEAPIIVQGTPRSGSVLEFDKMETVEQYKMRDEQLRIIGKTLLPDAPPHPQELLDSWGRGEHPGNLIPSDIIEGKAKAKKSLLARLRSVASSIPKEKISGAGLSESERNLFSKVKEGSNLNWLGIRKAGLILNRLHGGSWAPLEETPSRSLESKASTKGRSLLDLHRAAQDRFVTAFSPDLRAKALSIWNSTSMATKVSLNLLRNPKSVKLRKGGIQYR